MKNKITLSVLCMLFAFIMLPVLSKGQCPDGVSASPYVTTPIVCIGGNTGVAQAGASGGTSPYTYSWSSGGGSSATLDSYVLSGSQTFSYEAAIQHFTIPVGVSQVSIAIAGAQGGTGDGVAGGVGASFMGVCTVTSGHVLSIVVGQAGTPPPRGSVSAGGGGASWVYDSTAQPGHSGTPSLSNLLAVGAGGGGTSYTGGVGGAGGTDLSGNSATPGSSPSAPNGGSALGGTTGSGGAGAEASTGASNRSGGAGGAGWLSNGGELSASYAIGGNDWANKFVSAAGYFAGTGTGGTGGFGGGGGGSTNGAGGGGGYNGGGGGYTGNGGGGGGGGGGSYLNGTVAASPVATNIGNGSVTISYFVSNNTGVIAGTYTVNVTDNNGCSATGSVTITQPGVLRDSISSAVTGVCAGGGTNGSATVGVEYGTAPYTYSWSNGGTDSTITGLSIGTYSVTVQDNCGASATASVTLTQVASLTMTASITSSNVCSGVGAGDAQAFPSGGATPYTYSWSTGATTAATGSVLSGGTYSVTVTDNCGTSVNGTVIMPLSGLSDSIVTASTVGVSCYGGANGSAIVGATGGVSPYTYSWSEGGGTNASINSFDVTGSQTFTYTGAIQNFTIPSGVSQISVTVTGAQGGNGYNSSYIGADGASFTGVVAVTAGDVLGVVTGGIGVNGSGTSTAGGGGGGSYVWDENTTTLLAAAGGGGGAGFNTSGSGTGGTDLTGNLATNGGLTNGAGGTGGNGGAAGTGGDEGAGGGGWLSNGGNGGSDLNTGGGDLANGFAAGRGYLGYAIYGGGGFGGGGGGSFAGGGGGGYNGGGGGNSSSGYSPGGGGGSYLSGGTSNLLGSATANNTGNGSVTIAYSSLSSTGLIAGTYSVMVTDQNGCVVTASVTITQPSALRDSIVTASTVNVTCNDGSNGVAVVGAAGGTAPYTYSWSSGEGTSSTINTTYVSTSKTFSYEAAIQNFTVPNCVTQISVTVTGGQGGAGSSLSSISNPGADGASFTGVSSVTPGHILSVVVGNIGGSASAAGYGGAGGGASWIYDSTSTGAHTGTPSLSALLAVAGGGGGGGYNGSPGSAGGTDLIANAATNDAGGSNAAGGTGGNGGIGDVKSTGATSAGGGAGGAGWISRGGYTPSGGYGGYDWAPSSGTPFESAFGDLAKAGYGGYGGGGGGGLSGGGGGGGYNGGGGGFSNGGGGGGGGSFFNTAYGSLPTNITATNAGSGSVTFTYLAPVIGGVVAGTYSVTVTDANGCSTTTSIVLTQPSVLGVTASVTSANACSGVGLGSATAIPSNGTTPYTYSWSTGATTASTGSVLSAGTYSVTVMDNCGASANTTVVMSSSALRDSIVTAATVNLTCNGASNGSALVGAVGGASPYTYSWSAGGGSNAAINSYLLNATQTFSYEAAIQNFTVPAGVTQVSINIAGAEGGAGLTSGYLGGYGASYTGIATVTPGHILSVVVGSIGAGIGAYGTGGGGGASWVYDSTLTGAHTGTPSLSALIAVAAGGGGSAYFAAGVGGGSGGTDLTGNSTTNGGSTNSAGGTGGNGGGGGNNGSGGNGSGGGAGGAGWFSNGTTGISNGTGGNDWANSFASASGDDGSDGGFGGGGGASNNGGGGGGGYNGGGGGVTGVGGGDAGGGGSYFNTAYGSLPGSVTATNTGNGSISISYLGNGSSGLIAGTYSVTVTDNNGCTATASVTITQPNALHDSISSVTELCYGESDGSASVGANYGTPPYTYSWSTGSTNSTVSGLSLGGYAVTVQDNCGASVTASVILTQPVQLSATASIISANICSGGNNGDAEVYASGGTSPYTYSWSNGTTTAATGSVLSGGAYIVTVHDNCGALATVVVNMPGSSLRDSIITAATVGVACNGGATGSAEVGVKGGVSPYTYLWSSGGGTNSTINSYFIGASQTFSYTGAIQNFAIPAGISQVTINITGAAGGYGSDPTYLGGDGASFTGVVPVTAGHILSVVVGGLGGGTGTNGTGGGGGASWVYDSTLTGGHTGTPSLSALLAVAAGGGGSSYYGSGPGGGAGGTDLTGNSTTNGYSVNSPGGTSGNGGEGGTDGSFNPESCGGTGGGGWLSNASGTSDGTNGNDWANSFASAPGDGGSDGGYGGGGGGSGCGGGGGGGYNGGGGGAEGVGGGDAGGGGSYLIGGTATLVGSVTATNTSNGLVSISYAVSSVSGLAAGTYSVTVTDNNGCTTTARVNITQPSALISTAFVGGNVSCNGGSNGITKTSVSGGKSPYSYSWSPVGGSAYIANGLSMGTYTVTVTDNNGCSATSSTSLTQPSLLRDSAIITYPACNGETAGATIGVTGGTGPYGFAWSPNVSTTATATGLTVRSYVVQVKDHYGCNNNLYFSISQPVALHDSVVPGSIIGSCNGAGTGSAAVGVKYGNPPYTYSWSRNGGNNSSATGLSAGVYTVTVSDGSSCSATTTVTIGQPGTLSASAFSGASISCNGGSNGQAKVSVSGGSSPYIYSWWSPVSNSTYIANGLSTGTYTVSVMDNCGASATSSAIITQPALLRDSVALTYPVCAGGTGTATIGVKGGTGTYSFVWTPNVSTTASAAGLSVRSYEVQVKDHNGCNNNLTFSITQPPALRDSIVKSATVNVSCNGSSTGSATVGVKYGTSPYTYSWSGNGGNSSTAGGLTAGVYTVTVNDAGGCTVTASVTITQPNALLPNAYVGVNVTCNGGSTGQAKVSVSGGSTPYMYSWSPGGATSSTVGGLSAGTYTINVTDNCSASATSSVVISQPALLKDSVTKIYQPACTPGATGEATIGVAGGTTPYKYAWSPNVSSTDSASGLTVRNYVVQVKDNNGCSNNLTLNVTCSNGVTATYKPENTICCPVTDNINLYPNPNTGQFTISGLQQGMILELYDYTGKMISTMTTTNETMQLNIFNQANGVYLIRILDKDGNLIGEKKVVKTQ